MAATADAAAILAATRLLRGAHADLVRTYGSIQLIDRRDLSLALLDSEGRVVSATAEAHLGNLEAVAVAMRAAFGELAPGDAAITSDPSSGGTRVNDHFLVVPVDAGGRRLGQVVIGAPFYDVGGKRLGNSVPEATDIFAEGVRTLPLRVRRSGRVDRDIVELLKLNSRVPALVAADVAALLAVATVLAERAAGLLASALPAALLAGTRETVEQALARVPDGVGHRRLEAGGVEVRVALRRDGLPTFDLGGSSPQQPSNANATLPTALSAVARAVRDRVGCRLDSGLTAALRVVALPGTVVSALDLAAVGDGLRGTCGALEDLVRALLAPEAAA